MENGVTTDNADAADFTPYWRKWNENVESSDCIPRSLMLDHGWLVEMSKFPTVG